MVPGAIVVLEALPLSPNGKLDRKALPAPDFAMAKGRLAGSTLGPKRRSSAHSLLKCSASQGLDRGNFFELGGDSISSMQLVAKARKAGLHHQSARCL